MLCMAFIKCLITSSFFEFTSFNKKGKYKNAYFIFCCTVIHTVLHYYILHHQPQYHLPESHFQTSSQESSHADLFPPSQHSLGGWRVARSCRCSVGCTHAETGGCLIPGTVWPALCSYTLTENVHNIISTNSIHCCNMTTQCLYLNSQVNLIEHMPGAKNVF